MFTSLAHFLYLSGCFFAAADHHRFPSFPSGAVGIQEHPRLDLLGLVLVAPAADGVGRKLASAAGDVGSRSAAKTTSNQEHLLARPTY